MIAVVFILLAIVLWVLSQRTQQAAGLPTGDVVYTDAGGWGRLRRPLVSRRLQLTGKPDYLVRDGATIIPVEVKTGRAPAGRPYDSHVYQLAAYCALVTEAYGRRPTHGLIKYNDQTVAVDYTPELEADLLKVLEAMRADETAEHVERSHQSAARCRGCGLREECDERIIG
ncbi:MAG: CRISPR-associated protein Cas4 [Chloroflexi bacterium]|nr:CRISPR-associated protein Cas4 [Chloroflexota bacterium]